MESLLGLATLAKVTTFGAGAKGSKNFPYLFAVYTIIWVVLFGYLFYLNRSSRKLRQDLEIFKETLKKKG